MTVIRWVNFLPLLKISLSFAALQGLGNVPCEIERLQISLIDLAKISATSFRNLPGSLSMPVDLEISILFHYFKNLVSDFKLLSDFEIRVITFRVKVFDIVFMPYANDLLLTIALKFETTLFLGMPRDFRVFHNSFSLATFSEFFIKECLLLCCY